jgi:hypothetical protein
MTNTRLYASWALLLVLVPAISHGLGRGGGRAGRYFSLACLPVMFLLLAFLPRGALELPLAVLASVAAASVVATAYVVASPHARHALPHLLGVLALVALAALGAVRRSTGLGTYAFAVLLTATMVVAAWLGVQIAKRVG